MKRHANTFISFLGTTLLMIFIASAGAYAASGIIIGGRALVDVVPTEEIKSATRTAFRPQSVDLVSNYALGLADRAIHLEFSTYDHLLVLYNLVVSMPDESEIIGIETPHDMLVLTGSAGGRETAQDFEERLKARGFEIAQADYADTPAGVCVFRFELPIAQSNLSIP